MTRKRRGWGGICLWGAEGGEWRGGMTGSANGCGDLPCPRKDAKRAPQSSKMPSPYQRSFCFRLTNECLALDRATVSVLLSNGRSMEQCSWRHQCRSSLGPYEDASYDMRVQFCKCNMLLSQVLLVFENRQGVRWPSMYGIDICLYEYPSAILTAQTSPV